MQRKNYIYLIYMASFQKTVLTIAVVFLIIMLLIFAMLISSSSKEFPPIEADCPDYWIDLSGGIQKDGNFCVNTKNLGNPKCKKKMNFNTDFWTGSDGLCNKQTWADKCNLTWDGVTNAPDACNNDDNDSDDSDDTTSNVATLKKMNKLF
jgi:hypothetical protein